MRSKATMCLGVRPVLLLLCAAGCQAYDSALLDQAGLPGVCGDGIMDVSEFCDTAIAEGMPGACPSECTSADACAPLVLAGSNCRRHCVSVHLTDARNGDGCCPAQISPAEDSDCGFCGDEIVGPAESCDPPESCPSRDLCVSDDSCIMAVFIGKAEACTAHCELKPIAACLAGDGCCPAGCSNNGDPDCSASCGDGVVDARAGETCEAADKSKPCTESCDDRKACTRDLPLGSAGNCNARCSHIAITEPASEDGCCPAGAHSLNDDDCAPVCGNDVTEADEECDWSELCSAECTRLVHASLMHRYGFAGTGTIAGDDVGGADGTIVNTELTGSGELRLAGGTSDQYVDLPNGLISGLGSATVEVWLSWSGASDWQRIFDFGNNTNGEGDKGGAATSFWFLTTSNAGNAVGTYVNFTAVAGDSLSDGNAIGRSVFGDGMVHHVAAVFDGATDTMRLYVDGELQASRGGMPGRLASIDDRNVWIGRSNWGDDDLDGTIEEFRVYGEALGASDIRQSYETGPNPRRTAAARQPGP